MRNFFFVVVCMLANIAPLYALAQAPTTEQLEAFRNLPPEQRQALASEYGISVPSSSDQPQDYQEPQIINPRPDEKNTFDNIDRSVKTAKLKRFGVDLFSGSPTTFAPISDVPVPADYTVGVGDEIVVQLYGTENKTYRLFVNRAGMINFPALGPVSVVGMNFSRVQETLNQRVKEQLFGVRSDISLGKIRTMQIFVMGDAYKPGAYTVSSLTTISQAIYYSGGFAQSGSLRNIALKRKGKLIRQLDMYELLLKGNARNDVRLMPGDVVFIGAVGNTLSIDGEVNRPGVYEIKAGETFKQVIQMAGGFTANALDNQIEVRRYRSKGARDILTLNFRLSRDLQKKVNNGDSVKILKKSEELTNYVQIQGDVHHPAFVEWKPNLRIATLFQSVDTAFNATADVNYAVVVREVNSQRDIEVLQVNLAKAILSPKSKDNLRLKPRDKVVVFNRFNQEDLEIFSEQETETKAKSFEQAQARAAQEQKEDRLRSSSVVTTSIADNISLKEMNEANFADADAEKIVFRGEEITQEEFEVLKQNTRRALLAPVLLQLQQQSRLGLAPQIAEVSGEVKYPGRYPITSNMTVSTLLEAAGGLTYNAFTINAELARTLISKDERASINLRRINLRKVLQGDISENAIIISYDRLNILEKPNIKLQSTVTLQGEVHFPGIYTVRQGETLSQLLERAGGLTKFAHSKGAIFTREALRLQEQRLLDQYAADIRSETAKKTFRADGNSGSLISDPEKTLAFVEEASRSKALGRMVVQLDRVLSKDYSADFMLEDGDFLFIPTFRNTVSVMGEVQIPITYLLDKSLDVDDYLNKAGGTKKQADEDRTFVVRADGSIYKPTSGYWFGNHKEALQAGDTIVVPIDTNYRDTLSKWTSATQILYQAGVAINALR